MSLPITYAVPANNQQLDNGLGALPSSNTLSVPLMTSQGPLTISPPGAIPTINESASVVMLSGAGLILSPAAESLPQKLVGHVRAGRFVDKSEFFCNNISLKQQLDAIKGQVSVAGLPGVLKPKCREVILVLSWTYAFLSYMAIATNDSKTRDQLAYAQLIIWEAQHHGDNGWLDYNLALRKQLEIDPSLPWNTPHPGLQAARILGQGGRQATGYSLCREYDHQQEQCALTFIQPPSYQPLLRAPAPGVAYGHSQPVPGKKVAEQKICFSWNQGQCIYQGSCRYQHHCFTYQHPHPARDCPVTPASPPFKKNSRPPLMPRSK